MICSIINKSFFVLLPLLVVATSLPRSIYLLIYLFQLKYEIKQKHLHFGWLDKFGRFFPKNISFVQTLLKANIHFF